MYIGLVPTAKKMLEKVLDDEQTVSAEEILKAIEFAYNAIELLETETNFEYESGKAYGMERMAEILCGDGKE